MPHDPIELLPGTLELLVLKALSLEPMHGWGIGNRIDQLSGQVFSVQQGSLYPALQRMLRKGWVRSEWRASDNNRRARYYILTREGARQLAAETSLWQRASGAVNGILQFWPAGVGPTCPSASSRCSSAIGRSVSSMMSSASMSSARRRRGHAPEAPTPSARPDSRSVGWSR